MQDLSQSPARQLHGQAAEAREAEQFIQSLTLNDQALFAYDKENDAAGFAEGIGCRSITLRVYAKLHKSKRLLTLAKYQMMAGVEIAREVGPEALVHPLFQLAGLQEALEEFDEATKNYKEAVESVEAAKLGAERPAMVADMKVHLYTCAYKNGDKSALKMAQDAIEELIQAAEPNQFNKDVWLSGGYMRLAEILQTDDAPQAKEYLEKAKEIIDANPKLTLRKKQLIELSSKFFSA